MRGGGVFFTCIALLFVIFLCLGGIILCVLPWATKIRELLAHWVLDHSSVLALVGLGLLSLGVLLAVAMASMQRRRLYHLKMGDMSVAVSEELLEQYVVEYWKGLFPEVTVPTDVWVNARGIHISAELPSVPFEEQKPLLQRLEQELSEVFRLVLQRDEEFFLSASFPVLRAQT